MTDRVDPMPAHSASAPPHGELVATIVAAYAGRPDTKIDDIVELTRKLTAMMGRAQAEVLPVPAGTGEVAARSEVDPPLRPVVPVEGSVGTDEVLCLCCGKGFRTLKRHLMAAHNMTETGYRAAFGLAPDYPLVAPSYSERRSQVASETGFGTYDRAALPRTADAGGGA